MYRLYFKFKQKASVAASFFVILYSVFYILNSSPVHARLPNDPLWRSQEPFYDKIGALTAWDFSIGTTSVVVAVIDTGVDINHADLKNNIWKNSKEIPDNKLDDDRNGYIDDVYGWNFVEQNNDVSISVVKSEDDSGAVNHGTILAGLIGAEGNNDFLGVGLNWRVKIMSIRAISNAGGGSLENVASAVNYAADNGADIINVSFVGTSVDADLINSLRDAYKKGVLIVAAAGNDRNDDTGIENLTKVRQYPICLDADYSENWILGVTAVNLKDQLSSFADYGSCVDISAPGELIYSTHKYAPEYGYTENFDGAWSGSSFSTPLVAGAAALIKSIRPDWQAKELISNLLASADDIDGLNPGYAGQIGYGRLNVGRAVALAVESKSAVSVPKPPLVFESKLIKKKKKYFVRITSDGKVLHELPLQNYVEKNTKWAVKENLLVSASLKKNKISVSAWDWAGNKKLTNFVLPGISNLYDLKIDTVWGDSPNPVLSVKRGGNAERIIIDIPSNAWKTAL